MPALFPRLRFIFSQAWSGLRGAKGVSALSVFTVALALSVLASFLLLLGNLNRVADQLGRALEVEVSLRRGVAPTLGPELAERLAARPDVDGAEFVMGQRAMEALRQTLGEDARVLDGLPEDLLPPSVLVRLVARPWQRSEVERLAATWRGLPGVVDVQFGHPDGQRVHMLLTMARWIAWALGGALCAATVLIVFNTIRLIVYARRREIEVMLFCGATGTMVRAPFVLEGALQGLCGGLGAALLVYVLRGALAVAFAQALSSMIGPVALGFLPLPFFLYLALFGAALGVSGSLLAVGRFLRV